MEDLSFYWVVNNKIQVAGYWKGRTIQKNTCDMQIRQTTNCEETAEHF